MNKQLNIGLFGLGVVGSGLWDILQEQAHQPFNIRKIGVQNPEKQRTPPAHFLTLQPETILEDPGIDVIVEAITHPEEALALVTQALRNGKDVITANKKMLARYLPQLLETAATHQRTLLYESAACGGIPVVRTLDEYFSAEPLDKLYGIFNGTSNYLLTQMFRYQLPFAEALKQAQEKGFAEADPSDDIDGADAKHKLILLSAHGQGLWVHPDQVLHFGIRHIQPADIAWAQNQGATIKLVPTGKRLADNRVALYVMPQLIQRDNPLFHIHDEFNSVHIEGLYSGRHVLTGRGAGSKPTASAIIADLLGLQRRQQYRYAKKALNTQVALDESLEIPIYIRLPKAAETTVDLNPVKVDRVHVNEENILLEGHARLNDLKALRESLHRAGAFVMQR